ncbi:MAG TPA: hypothetical protein VHV77_16210 [Pirellulales bacterium]|jgi:hypothetical protein|nr:hypothetical protein [Pirellulales bacterium]
MMSDEAFRALEREAVHMHATAPWLSIQVDRDAQGKPRAQAQLSATFNVDPDDLAGSLIREIHRRLDEFESQLDD